MKVRKGRVESEVGRRKGSRRRSSGELLAVATDVEPGAQGAKPLAHLCDFHFRDAKAARRVFGRSSQG